MLLIELLAVVMLGRVYAGSVVSCLISQKFDSTCNSRLALHGNLSFQALLLT